MRCYTGGAWIGRSVRLPFPTDRDFDARVKRLVDSTRKALKETGQTTVIRLGYSAIDFVTRPAKGIESFFVTGTKKSCTTHHMACKTIGYNDRQERQVKPRGIEAFLSSGRNNACMGAQKFNHNTRDGDGNGNVEDIITDVDYKQSPEVPVFIVDTDIQTAEANRTESLWHQATQSESNIPMPDEEIARQLQVAYDKELGTDAAIASMQHKKEIDQDKALALKLQSSYDKEHAVLSGVERYSKRKSGGLARSQEGGKMPKKYKIDSYFSSNK